MDYFMKKTFFRNKKNFVLTICVTFLASNLANFFPNSNAYAETKPIIVNNIKQNEKNNIAEPENNSFGSFFGQQFLEPNFKKLAAVSSENLDKKIVQQHLDNGIRSVRWKTTFSPNKNGKHTFSLPNGFEIFVNDKKLANKQIDLSSEQKYNLFIDAPNLANVALDNFKTIDFRVADGETNSLDTKFVSETENKNFTNTSESPARKKRSADLDNPFPYSEDTFADSDEDGILDSWETNGYTRIGNKLVQWDEQEHATKGNQKYVSNPYNSHTTGDPFGDYYKALGMLDSLIDKTARNPMVAAVPSLSVIKEKIVLSKNQNVTDSNGGGIDITNSTNDSTSTTQGNSVKVGVKTGIKASLNPFTPVEVSGEASLERTHTDSNTTQNTKSKSETKRTNWSTMFNLNEADTARINANIRYKNYGTAPVYDAKPTVNFVLGNETLATVSMQENQIAKTLEPNIMYPKVDKAALSVLAVNNSGSKPLGMNKTQLERFDKGEEFGLELAQYSGKIGYYNLKGNIKPIFEGEWGHLVGGIYKQTAGFSLDLGNGTVLERRVAAKDLEDPHDTTAQLTVREALKIAFQAVENENGDLTVADKTSNKKYLLKEELVELKVDNITEQIALQQIKKDHKINSFYDTTLHPDMTVHIEVAQAYTDFHNNQNNIFVNLDPLKQNSGKEMVFPSSLKPQKFFIADLPEDNSYRIVATAKCVAGAGHLILSSAEKYSRSFQINEQYKKFQLNTHIVDDIGVMTQGCDLHVKNIAIYSTNLQDANYLTDGASYIISSLLLDDLTIDVLGQDRKQPSNGSSVHLMGDNGKNSQKWVAEYDIGRQAYRLRNVANRELFLAWNSAEVKGVIVSEGESDAQYWSINLQDKWYVLTNYKDKDKVLGVQGDDTANNNKIEVNSLTKEDNQIWKIELDHSVTKRDSNQLASVVDGATYTIHTTLLDDSVVDASWGNDKQPSNGSSVHLMRKHGKNNQKWLAEYDTKKQAYKFRNVANSKLFLAWNSGQNNNVIVSKNDLYHKTWWERNFCMFSCKNSDEGNDNYWFLQLQKDGSYILANYKDSKKVLDLHSGETANRTNVEVNTFNGHSSQKWFIQEAS